MLDHAAVFTCTGTSLEELNTPSVVRDHEQVLGRGGSDLLSAMPRASQTSFDKPNVGVLWAQTVTQHRKWGDCRTREAQKGEGMGMGLSPVAGHGQIQFRS